MKKNKSSVKPFVKRKAAHRAATKSQKATEKSQQEETAQEIHPFPGEGEQNERLNQLVEDVREAFTRNQFAIPGDIDLQIRGMAMLFPHHAPLPETQPGPGVVQPATAEAGIR